MVRWKAVKDKASDLYGKGKEAYEKYDELTDIDLNSNDITPGLTPISDSGWYSTPNEPADPRDCDRYPDSMYCGGNPFANPLKDSPVSIEPEVIWNQCDRGIKLSSTFGWVKLPPVHLVYRNEECRNRIPRERPVPFQPEIPPLTLPDLDPNALVGIFLNFKITFNRTITIKGETRLNQAKEFHSIDSLSFSWLDCFCNERYFYGNGILNITDTAKRLDATDTHFKTWNDNYTTYNIIQLAKINEADANSILNLAGCYIPANQPREMPPLDLTSSYYQFQPQYITLISGKWVNVASKLKEIHDEVFYFNELDDFEQYTKYEHLIEYSIAQVLFFDCTSYQKSPPPLPPDKRKCCMACCPQNSQSNNDQLLKLLLQKVNKLSEIVGVDAYPGKLTKTRPGEDGKAEAQEIEIKTLSELVGQVYLDVDKASKAIGIDDYPVKLPKSLIEKYKSSGGSTFGEIAKALDDLSDAANPDGTISTTTEVPSLTQLFAWYIERFDEVVGQFEIPIEIKDADILKDGDQPVTIRLPNIAEAIAEMFMLLFQSQVNTEVLINMMTRSMIEGGQDKQQNFISYQLLLSLVDWAGFKTKDVRKDMNLLFTPGKNSLDEFLDASKQSVVVQEFDEKFGLEVDMMRFRKAAAILNSVFFRKINPEGDVKGQVMKYLLNSLDTAKKLDNVKGDKNSDSSFEKFLEDAEVGFTQTPGISDSTHPYGRDYTERPRIRDLSQNQSNNNSGDA